MRKITPEEIDALLPQTQCGLCGYGGCMPYAEALVYEKAAINLCPPGGVTTLNALANLLQQDVTPFMADMQQKQKPKLLAIIREAECIGCTKCIQACPVDAIVGSAKKMHTVIADECTGCELCVPPCPVDCISVITRPQAGEDIELNKANVARKRFNARQARLQREEKDGKLLSLERSNAKRKDYIVGALARIQRKKMK